MRKKLFVLTLLFWVATSAAADSDVMRIHFIDVGQGDAALVEFPCGTVLIDTGGEASNWKEGKLGKVFGGSNAAVGYLQGFFNSRPEFDGRLDLLILTHPHIDHTNGAPQITRSFRPKNLVHNNRETGSGLADQERALAYATEDPEVKTWYVLERTIPDKEGFTNDTIDPIACDGVDPEIRVLWGEAETDDEWHKKEFSNENNHSVVVRIDYGEASVLFTGDLEESEKGKRAGIERLIAKYEGSDLLDVDVYQVGHHGSANGTTDELAEVMSPEIAVLSHGPECEIRDEWTAWQYHHPRKETIDELLSCDLSEDEPCLSERNPAKGAQIYDTVDRRWESTVVSRSIYSTGWDGTIVLEAKPTGEWKVASLSGSDVCLLPN